jgi:hypothetical protein
LESRELGKVRRWEHNPELDYKNTQIVKIKVGVMSSMITFVGGFGVSLLHLQIQSSMLRVGSFSGESAENKFNLKILHPIYSSCYSTFSCSSNGLSFHCLPSCYL